MNAKVDLISYHRLKRSVEGAEFINPCIKWAPHEWLVGEDFSVYVQSM